MRPIPVRTLDANAQRHVLQQQWLVTNGLGGYASATVAGALSWRYHGLLVAALPAPLGRVVMLNHVLEAFETPDGARRVFGGAAPGTEDAPEGTPCLEEFHLDHHLPVWRYRWGDIVLEKRILMPHLQNTVHLQYTLLTGPANCRLRLTPAVHFREFESSVATRPPSGYRVELTGTRFEIHAPHPFPPLRLLLDAPSAEFTYDCGVTRPAFYERDAARGYEAQGELWMPGHFSLEIPPERTVTLIASTEEWHIASALEPAAALATEIQRRQRLLRVARQEHGPSMAADLVLAADQFIISPVGRVADGARARASGDELRSVIAGYHWFTDWGRDTMISLEGLTMVTRRYQEAAWILRTFAHYVRDGLLPNMFPEGRNDGLYHTADATLWFFHAVHRYVQHSGDRETLRTLLPTLREIIEAHLRGTRFGIRVDPEDGLLRQGEPGYQLTWMDAKVGDWVVTPRRGKAVEINALWYNALRLMAGWLRHEEQATAAAVLDEHADRAQAAFNRRFWNAATSCLFDVIDGEQGDDPAIRPNQVLAIALAHPVLTRERWAETMRVVEEKLLTPMGLRSLSPDHPDYKRTYTGDLRSRDAAYHQGTVWAWLIGPFIDAWLKVNEDDRRGAHRFLEGFASHLQEGCIGSISEVFDAEPPFSERGCIAQAWSVAEVLRCLVATEYGQSDES